MSVCPAAVGSMKTPPRSSGPRTSLAAEAWDRFPKFILGFVAASVVCSFLFTRSPETALWVDGATLGFTSRLRGWLFRKVVEP